VGSVILTVVTTMSTVFWNVTPCSPVEVHRPFGGTIVCLFTVEDVVSKKQAASCTQLTADPPIRIIGTICNPACSELCYRNLTIYFMFCIIALTFLITCSRNYIRAYVLRRWCNSATGYGLDGRGFGVRIPIRVEFFSSPRHLDRLWGPPSLLANHRGFFPRV
jgi:hypothetical protein